MVQTHDLSLISGKFSYPLLEESEWIFVFFPNVEPCDVDFFLQPLFHATRLFYFTFLHGDRMGPRRKAVDLSQVCLQAVLSIRGFRYAVREGHVGVVELVPHFVGRGAQQDLDLVPQLVGGGSFALGVQDVVVCEPGPRVRQGESDRGKEG